MTGSLVSLFWLCLAATCLGSAYSMVTFSCPRGCIEKMCLLHVGCPKCTPGWCARYGGRNIGTACVPMCPPGEFCYEKGGNVCVDCRVSNCHRCTAYHRCESCDSGFTLSTDKRQCTRIIG
ncbi:hypothetical protein ACJMK2_000411 [Sinanodonta woodiana]|uniref:Uncharacterized protein n=1 Tax=Sinanodonta woodiana TaxID=1069815 RepID=A0ABD3XSR2_SINWO